MNNEVESRTYFSPTKLIATALCVTGYCAFYSVPPLIPVISLVAHSALNDLAKESIEDLGRTFSLSDKSLEWVQLSREMLFKFTFLKAASLLQLLTAGTALNIALLFVIQKIILICTRLFPPQTLGFHQREAGESFFAFTYRMYCTAEGDLFVMNKALLKLNQELNERKRALVVEKENHIAVMDDVVSALCSC